MNSKELLKLILSSLEELKAQDISTLNVGSLTDVADYMVIATGTSNRHVGSLAEHVALEAKRSGLPALGIEGDDVSEWVLVDFGDVIVHVMQPSIRDFYDLESLWSGLEEAKPAPME
ncbi:MAG: ribosome silencing factor [Pseudomonadales bacterium]